MRGNMQLMLWDSNGPVTAQSAAQIALTAPVAVAATANRHLCISKSSNSSRERVGVCRLQGSWEVARVRNESPRDGVHWSYTTATPHTTLVLRGPHLEALPSRKVCCAASISNDGLVMSHLFS